jgi:putative chitinase
MNTLKGHIPDKVLAEMPGVMTKFEINTPLRLAHFLAQCAYESMNFERVYENLNYSADGLKRMFGLSELLAVKYERQPEKIANKVYANKIGNGPEDTKDGWKFRGRGYIQLTGRANYLEFSKDIQVDVTKDPDLVATKYPLLSAAWYFHKRGINEIADRGATEAVVRAVTKKINAGSHGINTRINLFNNYYKILNNG